MRIIFIFAILPHIIYVTKAISGVWVSAYAYSLVLPYANVTMSQVRNIAQSGPVPIARDMFATTYRSDNNNLIVAGGYDPATGSYLNGECFPGFSCKTI